MILSVVIPTHGKRPLLARTLEALSRQDLATDAWQIIVVDDGSRDDTGTFLRELSSADARLRVVSPERNVGRAAARNLGWRRADGKWVLFLDDDILAPRGLLRAHLDLLWRDPSFGTIGPAITDPAIADAPHFHYLDTRGVARLAAGPAPARYFVTQNAAVPRDALIRIGGFDEEFSAYGFEDMDIGFRLEDGGVHFQVLAEPVPVHVHYHTLSEYLEKKRICGRHSLAQLAARHPHRLREMRLDIVIDPPGSTCSPVRRIFRRFLAAVAGPSAARLAGVWPACGARPRSPALFCRCMDAAVLGAYCQGIAEHSHNTAIVAP